MIEIETLVNFFQSYGYISVFGVLLLCGFGLPVPEDISLVAGGIISGLGYTDLRWMFIVSLAGVLIGDSVVFNFGRFLGMKFFNKPIAGKLITPGRYNAIRKWFDKYGYRVLFAARFMPGLRTPIFLTAGITRFTSYPRFILIDGSAALISVPLWVFLGYLGASNREWLLYWITRSQFGILIIILIIAIIVAANIFIKKKLAGFNGNMEKNSEKTGY